MQNEINNIWGSKPIKSYFVRTTLLTKQTNRQNMNVVIGVSFGKKTYLNKNAKKLIESSFMRLESGNLNLPKERFY